MGSKCCSAQEEYNPLSKKLIKATTIKIPDHNNNISNNNSNNKQLIQSNDKITNLIQIYDVESQESSIVETNFHIIKSLKSFSQVSICNWLYLCGEYGSLDNGSMFLKFDLLSPIRNVIMLINSIYRHYKPAMIFFKKDYIIVVGGKNNLKCEIFHKTSSKWRALSDLPEERYGCCLINDDKNDIIYSFGGYTHKTKSYCSSLLKLNLKSGTSWETVVIKNSSVLARSFHSGSRLGLNGVILVGGSNSIKEYNDTIVEFDFSTKTAKEVEGFKLAKPARFDYSAICEFNNSFYFADEDDLIHVISKRENSNKLLDVYITDAENIYGEIKRSNMFNTINNDDNFNDKRENKLEDINLDSNSNNKTDNLKRVRKNSGNVLEEE